MQQNSSISQPAFSRRIKALEEAIGVELFDRTTSPLQLSEEGKIFILKRVVYYNNWNVT